MSEAELLAWATRDRPVYAMRGVMALSFAASLCAVIAAIGPTDGGSWLPALVLGGLFGWIPAVMVVLGLATLFDKLSSRIPYADELLRRAGWKPVDQLMLEAREQVAVMPDSGWLLVLHGRALPHGGQRFVRVELYDSAEQACVVEFGELAFFPRDPGLVDARDPRARLRVGTGTLSVDERDELLDLLSDADANPPRGWPKDGVIDGYPFDLLAVRQPTKQEFHVQGNLADPDALPHGRRLAGCLLDVAHRLGAHRAGYTTRSRTGSGIQGER